MVKKKYNYAYTKLGQNDFRAASRELAEIIEFYKDPDSKLIQNVEKLMRYTTIEGKKSSR